VSCPAVHLLIRQAPIARLKVAVGVTLAAAAGTVLVLLFQSPVLRCRPSAIGRLGHLMKGPFKIPKPR
jgi:hypothetical protein